MDYNSTTEAHSLQPNFDEGIVNLFSLYTKIIPLERLVVQLLFFLCETSKEGNQFYANDPH